MLYQVNKVLFKRNLLRQFIRYAHNEHLTSKTLYPLESRKLLSVVGPESAIFLQGLITNDMRHFEDGAKSIYAMFLNNKGRVLYDTIIHTTDGAESFLIECDNNITTQLLRHLRLFKLKRKIEIAVNLDYKVWCCIKPTLSELDDPNTNITVSKDPRLVQLGYRVLTPTCVDHSKITDLIGNDVTIKQDEEGYKLLRYKLGVAEGAEDLLPGSNFPLEANCDYMHGVNFHKGCYIGQELTARVHHTGVVRKRIMPLIFKENVVGLNGNSVISDVNKPKSNIGKLKGTIENYGLGLIRIKEAMNAQGLQVGKYAVEVVKPTWWPMEAPKEKLNKLIVD